MTIKSIFFLTAAGIMLAACQSKTYKISGTAEGMADGDTLYITSDMQNGTPQDTIIVKDGRFAYEGKSDSIHLAMIYSAARNEINAPFFMEPGQITITLSDVPGTSRVGGTNCNDQWQILNDSVMEIGKEINRIAEHIYGNNVSMEQQQEGMATIEKLNQRFSAFIVRTTEKNIKNEFGYFLLTYYPEELIDNETRARLIEELPDEMRNRQAIKQIEATILQFEQTAVGNTIKDFTQPGLDDTPVSLLEEVKKNKVTIIDFWASWCGPCRQEMPFMLTLYNDLKERGLGIIGISLDQDKDDWQTATQKLGISWPQMSDLKGWDNAIARHFNVTSIPHTIVVDQQGKILARDLRGEKLKAFVEEKL